MTDKEKLYEVMGELLYSVALADGVIQKSELKVLKTITANHKWASNIKWSFDYEFSKGQNVDSVYRKALSFCQSYGPAPEYVEFLDLMYKVAEASDGIDENEAALIDSFSYKLSEQFRNDIDLLK